MKNIIDYLLEHEKENISILGIENINEIYKTALESEEMKEREIEYSEILIDDLEQIADDGYSIHYECSVQKQKGTGCGIFLEFYISKSDNKFHIMNIM